MKFLIGIEAGHWVTFVFNVKGYWYQCPIEFIQLHIILPQANIPKLAKIVSQVQNKVFIEYQCYHIGIL